MPSDAPRSVVSQRRTRQHAKTYFCWMRAQTSQQGGFTKQDLDAVTMKQHHDELQQGAHPGTPTWVPDWHGDASGTATSPRRTGDTVKFQAVWDTVQDNNKAKATHNGLCRGLRA